MFMAKLAGLLKRSLVTPITTALFAVVAFTGILMLLHIQSRMIKEFHELMSLLFVVAAGLHLAVNWNAFVLHLRKPLTMALGAVVVALVVLMLTSRESGSRGGRSPTEVFSRIEAASLAQAAPALGASAAEPVAFLKARGLRVSNENQSIADIAKNNGKRGMEIISSLLAAGENSDRDASRPTNEAGSPPRRP